MAGYRTPPRVSPSAVLPYEHGRGVSYLPAFSPPPRRTPFAFTQSTPGAMGSNYPPPRSLLAPGGPAAHRPGAGAYTMQQYIQSLGYPNMQAYLHALGLDAPSYAPLSDTEAQTKAKAFVDSQLGPLLDRLNRDYAQRTQAGSAAIQSLTTMLAGLASQYGPQQGAAYNEAISQDKALAGGLADRLSGAGSAQSSELAAKLGQAGQDTSGAATIAGVGSGAANAGYAKDTAALEALVANSASAQAFGAKLPFIEGLTGVQAGQQYQSDLLSQLGQETSSVTGQAPAMTQNYLADLYSRDAAARTSYESAKTNRAQAQLGLTSDYVAARSNRQSTAENQRRYNAAQARQKLGDRQALLSNFESRTGYQGVLTSTGVTYKRGPDGQKVPTQATRADAYNKRQRALGVVGPKAPTVQGRKMYWDTIAENRTRDTGIVHVGTPTGIKPLIDPATGQPQKTIGGKASDVLKPQKVDLSLSRATGQWVDSSGQPVSGAPTKPPPPLISPTTKKPIKVDVGLSRASGRWVDSSGNPVRGAGLPPKPPSLYKPGSTAKVKVDVGLSRLSGRWVDSAGNPVHAPGLPPKPPAPTKQQTGTEPIRVGPGKWRTRGGVTLSPAGSSYWEKRFQDGFTDGKGHRQPGKRDSSGGTPGLIKKKKAGGP